MIVLYVVAGVAEVIGLLLALHGFRRTWAEFGSTDDGLRQVVLAPMTATSKRLAARLETRVRALIRRPKAPIVHSVTGVITLSSSLTARGRVSFGPLPAIADDPEAFAVEVHSRIQTAHEKAQVAQEAAQDEAATRATQVAALQQQLDDTAGEMESMSRTIAVGGLVEQIYGWMFIFAGTALGTLGNVIEAASQS